MLSVRGSGPEGSWSRCSLNVGSRLACAAGDGVLRGRAASLTMTQPAGGLVEVRQELVFS